jgi:FtsZ-interacting cell division protein YlmF
MALKDSIRQLGRFVGVLQPQPPYDPYAYPPDDGSYNGAPYDQSASQNDGYYYGGAPQGNQGVGGGNPMRQNYTGQQQSYYADEYPKQPPQRHSQAGFTPNPQQSFTVFGNNQRSRLPPDNIVQMPRHEETGAQRTAKNSEMIIICVRLLDDCQEIINALLEQKTVFINMETADDLLTQRVIDILGGASFALRGTMTKISSRAYLVAPSTVDVVNNQPSTAGPSFRSDMSARRS